MSKNKIDSVHKAVMTSDLTSLNQSLKEGNPVDNLDREGRTPLFYASKAGNIRLAECLIEYGANVNARDNNLETPLHFAARDYQPEMIELLIQKGALVDAQDVFGNTPLSRAVFGSRGRSGAINALLKHGANKKIKNNSDVSPEDLARSISNYNVLDILSNTDELI